MDEIQSNLHNVEILDFKDIKIRIVINFIPKSSNKTAEFINSIIVSDLEKVLQSGEYSVLLKDFLNTKFRDECIDVRDEVNFSEIIAAFTTSSFPSGAFASEYTLMFSQQFAVNQILKRFSKRYGFYAVNGPPRTGKTTLLKDVIAGIIVERAKILVTLDDDEILFKSNVKNEQGYPAFYILNPKLQGFEIVVALSNNGAVENISKEVPQINSIATKYLGLIDYFKSVGSKLLGEQEAWALMCATLGRSDNVAKFNKIFCTQNGILKYLDKEAWKICSDEAWQNLKKAIKDCSTAWEKYKTCDDEKKKTKLKDEAVKLSKVKQNYQKYYDDFKNNRFKTDTQKFEIAKDEFLSALQKYENLLDDTRSIIKNFKSDPSVIEKFGLFF